MGHIGPVILEVLLQGDAAAGETASYSWVGLGGVGRVGGWEFVGRVVVCMV